MSVGKTIYQQIGHRTFFMLGMKNGLDLGNGLSFRIRGSKAVNYIKITLNALDLYDMEFGKVWGHNYKIKAEHKNVYADMMHKLIRQETGLATNL